ncbi:AtaL-like protein [Chitinilyticum litopenaei]|uniref:AtaL-like protein n=1 Tax=Chitinilyticum litopenaei TaxID=1121276 RepID=UPI000427FA6E|nr:AtaL-like protein [Chitinilyticum litopenaei]
MRHQHLVQVNDLANPHIQRLTRNQLWQGLVLRAREPQRFMEQLDDAQIVAEGEGWLRREMRFGSLLVIDLIEFEHEKLVRYQTQAGADHGGGLLLMQIEEPEAGALFVRFSYDTPHEVPDSEQHLLAYVRQAWQDTDVATISLIRLLAQEGLLG